MNDRAPLLWSDERMRKVVADAEEERRVLTVMKSVVARVRPMLPR